MGIDSQNSHSTPTLLFDFTLVGCEPRALVCKATCPKCGGEIQITSSASGLVANDWKCPNCNEMLPCTPTDLREQMFRHFDYMLKNAFTKPNPSYVRKLQPYAILEEAERSFKNRLLRQLSRIGITKELLKKLGVVGAVKKIKNLVRHGIAARGNGACDGNQADEYLSHLPSVLPASTAQYFHDFVLACRPIGLIRFGILYSLPFGNFISSTIIYIRERLAGIPRESLDYFSQNYYGVCSNEYYLKHLERYINITPAAFQLAHMFPHDRHYNDFIGHTDHSFYLTKSYDNNNLDDHSLEFSLKFTDCEVAEAKRSLASMGIPEGAPFVCLQVRDSGFYGKEDPANFRNVPLHLFGKAVKYLTDSGIYVLRMGSHPKDDMPWQFDKLIDYAKHFRSEFMDVWLYANSYLTISTGTGPDLLPITTARQTLYAGFVQLFTVPSAHKNLSVCFSRVDCKGRIVPLRELLAKRFYRQSELDDLGYSITPSSEDDILAAVKEKIFHMNGGSPSPRTLLLQEKFEKLFNDVMRPIAQSSSEYPAKEEPMHGVCRVMVSSTSLEMHADELGRL